MQLEGDTVHVLDGMVRNMCQLMGPYGKGHESMLIRKNIFYISVKLYHIQVQAYGKGHESMLN